MLGVPAFIGPDHVKQGAKKHDEQKNYVHKISQDIKFGSQLEFPNTTVTAVTAVAATIEGAEGLTYLQAPKLDCAYCFFAFNSLYIETTSCIKYILIRS